MTRLRLKSKMIIGSLAMAILVLVTTAVAVSIVINAQYREAVGGIQEVNQNLASGSSVAQTIARDIATVNKATGEVSAQSDRVSARAAQMSALADDLKAMVSRFKM